MPRLFTAIEIPEAIRLRLSLLRAPLAGAKWIEPENMHITVRFAGDIDGRTADEFVSFLAGVRARVLKWAVLCNSRGDCQKDGRNGPNRATEHSTAPTCVRRAGLSHGPPRLSPLTLGQTEA